MPRAYSADGGSIAYDTRGTGRRNLLFLHPWGGSGTYFDETIRHLDMSAARAITVDLRGHGRSDEAEVDVTFDLVARDVFAVADAVGAPAFVAVGHSMGGKLAQYLAVADRSRVEGLVLVESAPASAVATPGFVVEWMTLAGDGSAFLEEAVVPYIRRPVPEHVLRRYGEEWARVPRAVLERFAKLVESSFVERLRDVRVPALVVVGARDPTHSELVDSVRAPFPDAQLEVLDCGAEIPLELPRELARLVEGFVAALP